MSLPEVPIVGCVMEQAASHYSSCARAEVRCLKTSISLILTPFPSDFAGGGIFSLQPSIVWKLQEHQVLVLQKAQMEKTMRG